MKKYNTPHRRRVIKTRLTEEEYAEFSERVTLCKMSQSEYIRQALTKSSIRPVITVSPVNDELLSAVGKLTAEYGKIGGNLNQIARCLNEYGAPYNALSQEVRAATAELAALKFEVLQKVGEAVGNIHVHIVINSLRIAEVPLLPYMEYSSTVPKCRNSLVGSPNYRTPFFPSDAFTQYYDTPDSSISILGTSQSISIHAPVGSIVIGVL